MRQLGLHICDHIRLARWTRQVDCQLHEKSQTVLQQRGALDCTCGPCEHAGRLLWAGGLVTTTSTGTGRTRIIGRTSAMGTAAEGEAIAGEHYGVSESKEAQFRRDSLDC